MCRCIFLLLILINKKKPYYRFVASHLLSHVSVFRLRSEVWMFQPFLASLIVFVFFFFFGPFFSFLRLSGFRHWASRGSALAFGQ